MELADLKSALNPLMDRLAALETEIKTLKQSSASSPAKAEPAAAAQELHGLCEDQACETCAAQSQELVNGAFQQGRVAALEDMDQWLLMAGGEEVRQKIIEVAAHGQQLYEHSQQGVSIVA
mgnify:CR=1 FL=1